MSFIRKIINSATQKRSNTSKGSDMAKVSKAKKTTKKATAKKKTTGTVSKKKVTKKSSVKKVASKKTAAKKSPAKKKAAPKKAAAKKSPAKKKAAPKKAAAKKTATKKKTSPKKTTQKKSVTKKTAVKKKTSVKKGASTKTVAKKTPAKKKVSAKKTAPKKVEAKQAKATTSKKTTSKKVASKKQPIVATAKIPRKGNAADGPIVTPYQARKGENYMNKDQINHFVEILTNWKMELMQEVDRTVHHMKDESHNLPDPSDRASQEEEFSLELRTRDRERKLIRKIDKTLDAIKNDEFGYCEDCGIEIGVRRLEARPTATKCIDCKTLSELKERQTSL